MAVIIILGIIIPSSRSSYLAASLAMVIVGSFVLRSRFGLPYLFTFVIGLLAILTLYGFDLIQPFIRDIYNMNPMGVDLRFLGYSESLNTTKSFARDRCRRLCEDKHSGSVCT